MKKTWVILICIYLIMINLPLATGYSYASEDILYNGLVIAPIDGNSYLAKMMEGYNGAWKFTLPFTAQPGDGAYIFLYYLFLGPSE